MKIKQLGHPILREVSRPISTEEIGADDIQETIRLMKDILNGIKSISDENGNALSAPQAGNAVRLILLRLNGVFHPMINPELVELSEEMFDFEEECFSFYNLRGKVKRHKKVNVVYHDEFGAQQSMELEGEASGLIQHEIDHLNGIFFVDRIEDQASLVSIDYLLKDNPDRLRVVKEMSEYMAS